MNLFFLLGLLATTEATGPAIVSAAQTMVGKWPYTYAGGNTLGPTYGDMPLQIHHCYVLLLSL